MASRIQGKWITLQVEKQADLEQRVADLFAQNTYSHSIVFSAKKGLFQLYDRLLIRIDNKLFKSYISTIETKNNSDYADYTCGELQVQYPFLNFI